LFPILQGGDFDQLKADIAAKGLLESIWLHPDGSIIDGRNRHRACIETDTAPRFRTWDGKGSLVSFVVSLNLHRRHLSSGQMAACALEAKAMIAEEIAKQEQERKQRQNDPTFQRIEKSRNATAEAAELFNTNPQYVADAQKLQRAAPDLLSQVKQGEITIPQAKRELTKRQRQDAPPLPDDKYRVWYADPPWKYSDAGVINDDNYGRAERHYPVMTIGELCEMGDAIKDRCLPDAALFLWSTSPLLEDAFKIVKAWGFDYRTSFVWDKVRHNFGHYNSVRHEFLLVCIRGSCTPDNLKLFDSVQEIERTETHSQKPEKFRAIIDTLYTKGKRIELFSRKDVDGWDSWGNE